MATTDLGQLLMMQQQFASAMLQRGTPIALRIVDTSTAYNHPPTLVTPVVNGLTANNSSHVSISAVSAYGKLIAGDTLTFNGHTYTVTSTVNSLPVNNVPPGFTSVPITPNTVGSTPNATAITVNFSTDVTVYATIGSYPRRLIDGQLIQARDLNLTIPTLTATNVALPAPDTFNLVVMPDGDIRTIIDMTPNYVGATIISYSVHAR